MSRAIEQISRRYTTYDLQLRSYMVRVFSYMALALMLTGIASYLTFETGFINLFYSIQGITGLGWLVTFAPLVIVLLVVPKMGTMMLNDIRMALGLYSVLMGLSLSHIFITYAVIDITRIFFITACLFLIMSIYGHTTKRDLTSLGSLMMMGLIGVVIASLVNIFLKSASIYFVISVISVFVFIGLTAYDVQKLKDTFNSRYSDAVQDRVSLLGALMLYMDFINIFITLLHLFGHRRRD